MYITNVTDYDRMTDENNNTLSKNKCTIKENNIDILIPDLLLTIPCDLSFLCLMSFMLKTLIKLLFNNKRKWRNIYTQTILYVA